MAVFAPAARRIRAQAQWPPVTACASGVTPQQSVASTDPSALSKSRRTLALPCCAARCTAVRPSKAEAFVDAPARSRWCATRAARPRASDACRAAPASAAIMSAVLPKSSRISTHCGCRRTSTFVTSAFAPYAAFMRGVQPSSASARLASAPWSSNNGDDGGMAAQRCDAERRVAVPVLGLDLDASLQKQQGTFCPALRSRAEQSSVAAPVLALGSAPRSSNNEATSRDP